MKNKLQDKEKKFETELIKPILNKSKSQHLLCSLNPKLSFNPNLLLERLSVGWIDTCC